MTILVIKEMALEEKYDKLLESYWLNVIGSYALVKELGAVDKGVDLSVKVSAKMLPSRVGLALDILKALVPGTIFNQLINNYVYNLQRTIPLQEIEVNKFFDNEATLSINNCPFLERVKRLVEKTGLDIEPKSFCEMESKILQELGKEFGIDIVTELKENGCMNTVKLRIPMYIL